MLQRAASNAYSWWWASHIRTKQSKWLEQSLQDMEEKVGSTLKIIDDDGDSFAKRAEMYYRKRPELIGFVEESYKAFRALAERYDHLSREYQSANRKIASVFPEEVPFDIDEEDEESCVSSLSENQSVDLPDGMKARIPKVPKLPPKEFRSASMMVSRKGHLHKTSNSIEAAAVILGSGLTKEEALEEIDRLQKEILMLQTEKEFVKDLYERGRGRFWEIENQVTGMQARVCGLQDEFGIGTVIEDNEARALMAAAALKSCRQTLSRLQEKQELTAEETRIQEDRIREAERRLESLKFEYHSKHKDSNEHTGEVPASASASPGFKTPDSMGEDNCDLASMREGIKKELEVDGSSFLTVTEMVEKIDDLVEKVVDLKTGFYSQVALVKRLKEETDKLQEHIRVLEEERETLIEGSENMSNRIKELEEELRQVKDLKKNVNDQTNNLLSQFTEASCNLDHLSTKLENTKLDEEVENMGNEDALEAKQANDDNMDSDDKSMTLRDVIRNEDPAQTKTAEEIFLRSGPASDFDALSEKPPEFMHRFKEENEELYDAADTQFDIDPHGSVEGSDPNWRELFLSGADDRERMLLDEYTALLQCYKEAKKKLNVVEKKNRDSVFELAMQLGELRNTNALKEEEIQALRQKVDAQQTTTNLEPSSQDSQPPAHRQPLYKLLLQHNDIIHVGNDNSSMKMGEAKVNSSASAIEKKLRKDIDHLLEENLEFWLRFSTSIHQIQKFQTTVHDLLAELSKLKENSKKDASTKQHSTNADARPIYKHLKEIQTELKLWLEQNSLLKEEMQHRSSALCSIQDEITRVSNTGSGEKTPPLHEFQAAKFQGEVLNMKQENNKVADELEAGLFRVKKLNGEIEKTLSRLEKELGISPSKGRHSRSRSISSRSRIPLRSFLFGVKLRKQKQSIFSCVNPALQKQQSDMKPVGLD